MRLRPPPRSPRIAEISWRFANGAELAVFRPADRSLQFVNWISVPISVLFSLASKSRFPATETVDRRDSVRMARLTCGVSFSGTRWAYGERREAQF